MVIIMVMVEMTTSELYTLMANGTTAQKNFIEKINYSEFERIIEYMELEYTTDFLSDIRGWINGGVISIVDNETDFTELELDDGKFLEIQ